MKHVKFTLALFFIQTALSMQNDIITTDEQSHEFHVFAQQAAHTYLAITTEPTPQENIVKNLRKFISTYPCILRPYINLYAFMQFTHPEIHTCLCQELKSLFDQATPSIAFINLIEQLPTSATLTLHQAIRERHEDIALFAIALGANTTIPVPITLTCRCCSHSFFVPPIQKIPVIKLCTHMPRLKQKLEKTS